MKAKVNTLEENTKNQNIRELYKGINEFKKDYQTCTYIIKNDTNAAYTVEMTSSIVIY